MFKEGELVARRVAGHGWEGTIASQRLAENFTDQFLWEIRINGHPKGNLWSCGVTHEGVIAYAFGAWDGHTTLDLVPEESIKVHLPGTFGVGLDFAQAQAQEIVDRHTSTRTTFSTLLEKAKG